MKEIFWLRLEPKKVLGNPDVALMTAEEFGAYNLLLMYAWTSGDCSLTGDEGELARLARVSKVSERVMKQFKKDKDGRLFSEQLLADRRDAVKLSKERSKAANARWKKKDASEVQE